MRLLNTTFEIFKKLRQNHSNAGISSRLLLRGRGCFDPPKFCPDSDWGWCFDLPPNFEPRFFIQIMLKTKVLRWILYPYSSYFLAIFKVLEKSNRFSQNTRYWCRWNPPPSIRISKLWRRWIDPPLVVIGTKKQFFANFKF